MKRGVFFFHLAARTFSAYDYSIPIEGFQKRMANIMIVDDDHQTSGLLERVIQMYNHETLIVNESSRAMEMAQTFHPDLFILDLMMPEIDGFELSSIIRADPIFSNTPVIVVSAMEDKDAKAKAFSIGVSEYLTKPFNIMELGEKLDALLAK